MKAIKFKESDYYSVELSSGVYEVDGKPIEITRSGKVQVLDVHNVKPITRQKIISGYTSDGSINISNDSYNEQLEIFRSNAEYDEDCYEYVFPTLEAEYEYKKFNQKWSAIYKNIETIGDPYSVELIESQIDTGCKFVSSDYINGGKDPLLFKYDRVSAVHCIVQDKFKELRMEFKGKIDHNDTKHKKVWGNSSHSVIRYVVAFGTYIFGDKWQVKRTPLGRMDAMISMYDADKEELEEIINLKYVEHFGNINEETFKFDALLSTLRNSINIFNSVEPKSKSHSDQRRGITKINEAIKQIQEAHVV